MKARSLVVLIPVVCVVLLTCALLTTSALADGDSSIPEQYLEYAARPPEPGSGAERPLGSAGPIGAATTGGGQRWATAATLPYTTFVNVTIGDPITLDPHWMYDTSSSAIAMQVYETLVFYERGAIDEFVPLLARDWSISPDGRTYTFTIRSGITFHAGGSLTPEDVAYSFWRGLLQDRSNGPMWILMEPLLGVGTIDDFPGDDAAKCQAVKNAITYSDTARTVTFHLAEPFGPFIQILAGRWSSVLDKEWMAANGDWGGECPDWRDHHDPPQEGTLLYNQMNGTGPFKFEHWIADDEVALVRNGGYWLTEPLWDRGPAGPAKVERVLIKNRDDWETHRDMLQNGDADFIDVPWENAAELANLIQVQYDGPDDMIGSLVYATGTLRLVTNLPAVNATDVFFDFEVTADDNPYIGSGALDGNGIPSDFFMDIDVRKAFNYAFDWGWYITNAMGGGAVQRTGPIIAGMLGHDPAQPTYFYSPTLSAQHFEQAWGGQVWTNGFSLTLAYNSGNVTRQTICEILKQNIEAITDTFHVNIVGIEWDDFLSAYQNRRLPIRVAGWQEDYHHPLNWVYPYLSSSGAYGSLLPSSLTDGFDAKIDECMVLTGGAAHTCYAELQNMSYLSATHIFLAQSTAARHYERSEVRGWYHNAAYTGPAYYYALSKGPLPSATTVETDTSGSETYTSTSGVTTTVDVPAGAVTGTTTLVYAADIPVAERPGGFWFAGQSFTLDAYQDGEYVPGLSFNSPVTVTLHYANEDVVGLEEGGLLLEYWDAAAGSWQDAACGPYDRHPDENWLAVPICHLSEFALFGKPRQVFLPLVLKGQ